MLSVNDQKVLIEIYRKHAESKIPFRTTTTKRVSAGDINRFRLGQSITSLERHGLIGTMRFHYSRDKKIIEGETDASISGWSRQEKDNNAFFLSVYPELKHPKVKLVFLMGIGEELAKTLFNIKSCPSLPQR